VESAFSDDGVVLMYIGCPRDVSGFEVSRGERKDMPDLPLP
jgi:hypothetical protein